MKKRILAGLMALVMAVTLLPAAALAKGDPSHDMNPPNWAQQYNVTVGDKRTLTGSSSSSYYQTTITWSSTDSQKKVVKVTPTPDESQATVEAVGAGTATVTQTVTYRYQFDYFGWFSDTHTTRWVFVVTEKSSTGGSGDGSGSGSTTVESKYQRDIKWNQVVTGDNGKQGQAAVTDKDGDPNKADYNKVTVKLNTSGATNIAMKATATSWENATKYGFVITADSGYVITGVSMRCNHSEGASCQTFKSHSAEMANDYSVSQVTLSGDTVAQLWKKHLDTKVSSGPRTMAQNTDPNNKDKDPADKGGSNTGMSSGNDSPIWLCISVEFKGYSLSYEFQGDVPNEYKAAAPASVSGKSSGNQVTLAKEIKVDSETVELENNRTYTINGTNYRFNGWYQKGTNGLIGTDVKIPGSDITFGSSDIEMVGLWSTAHKVTYNANYEGASPATYVEKLTDNTTDKTYFAADNVTVLSNDTVKFSNDGYTFKGWSTTQNNSGDGNQKYNGTGSETFAMPNADVTLYAIWEEDETPAPKTTPVYVYFQTVDTAGKPVNNVQGVTYNGNGQGTKFWATLGSLSNVAISAPTTGASADAATLASVSAQVKTGDGSNFTYYTGNNDFPLNLVDFKSLKVDQGAKNFTTDYDPAWHLDGTVVGYHVIYKDKDDSGTDIDPTWKDSIAPTDTYYLATATNATVTSTVPTKDGWTFLGWSTTSGATTADNNYAAGKSVSFRTTDDDGKATDANITLYAVWRFNEQVPENNGTLTITKELGSNAPDAAKTKTYTFKLYELVDKDGEFTPQEITTFKAPNDVPISSLSIKGENSLSLSLPGGNYIVEENAATIGGYDWSVKYHVSMLSFPEQTPDNNSNSGGIIEVDPGQETNQFEFGPDDSITLTVTNTYTAKTDPGTDNTTYYYYAFRKVDAQDDKGLKGAKFGLYLDNSTEPLVKASSYDQGIVTFQLTTGEYSKLNKADSAYFQEITPPDGYVLSDTKYSVSANDFSTSAPARQNVTRKVLNYRTATPDLLNDSDHFAYVQGYKDGTVRPNGLISRAETTTIFFRLLKADTRDGNLRYSNDYTDVSDSYWANTAISTMSDLGIIQGYSNGTFNPAAPITRAQFAAICARFDTKKTSNEPTNFTDTAGHWAEGYIQRAVELGWIKGFEDGSFRPDAYITRAQAMTLINRVLNRIPEDEDDLLSGMTDWPDCKSGSWCYLAVQEATNSHNFKSKSGNYETWTSLKAAPDWSRYEN